MKRIGAMVLFVAGIIFGAQAAMATTFAVGTCRPKLTSFTTISAAVGSVPAGSTVEVCPGTYPEQVTISTPLTLLGANDGNADRAVIVVPPNGLKVNVSGVITGPTAAQVLVTTGPVTIIGITVDGTGSNLDGGTVLVGVFYATGSSGVVEAVTVRNEINNEAGDGIVVENSSPSTDAVTIEDSSVHDVDATGITVATNRTPATVTVNIESNDIEVGIQGILESQGAGVIESNVVTNTLTAIETDSNGPTTVSSNVVAGYQVSGIGAGSNGEIVKSNIVWNGQTSPHAATAIALAADGATVQVNRILNAGVGIGFLCHLTTISNNLINDVGTGIQYVPTSFNQFNNIINADTIRVTAGCP